MWHAIFLSHGTIKSSRFFKKVPTLHHNSLFNTGVGGDPHDHPTLHVNLQYHVATSATP